MRDVVVVGAGVLGASIGLRLARLGARVRIFDQHPAIASGVSGQSFGWVNLVHGDPLGAPAAYALRMAAVAELTRLASGSGAPACCRRVGSLVWRADPEDTRRLIDLHQAAGARIRPVGPAEIRAIEPAIAAPPACAAHCPDDLAVDVPAMVGDLLGEARALGAVVTLGERVAGFIPGLPGVYALAAHPGVILAPWLAGAAAAEIVGGGRDALLGDWTAA